MRKACKIPLVRKSIDADLSQGPELKNLSAGLKTRLRDSKAVVEYRLAEERVAKEIGIKKGPADVLSPSMPHIRPSTERAKVVSLFSGCGGLDLGFRGEFEFLGRRYDRLPFDIVWANDLSEAACRTYRKNISDHIVCGTSGRSSATCPSLPM